MELGMEQLLDIVAAEAVLLSWKLRWDCCCCAAKKTVLMLLFSAAAEEALLLLLFSTAEEAGLMLLFSAAADGCCEDDCSLRRCCCCKIETKDEIAGQIVKIGDVDSMEQHKFREQKPENSETEAVETDISHYSTKMQIGHKTCSSNRVNKGTDHSQVDRDKEDSGIPNVGGQSKF